MYAHGDMMVRCVCSTCEHTGRIKAEYAFALSVEVVLAQCNYADSKTRSGTPRRITFDTLRNFAHCRACARKLSGGTLKGFAPLMRVVRVIELLQQSAPSAPGKKKTVLH